MGWQGEVHHPHLKNKLSGLNEIKKQGGHQGFHK